MSDGQHSRLGASSAYRWISCPGSVREIEKLPEYVRERRNVYASEGTAAHTLAAECLRRDKQAAEALGVVIDSEEERINDDADADGERYFEVTEEMADAVQVYLDEARAQADRFQGEATIMVEQRVHLDWLDEDLWGTADLIIHEPFGELVVADYKHGSGVVVDVDFNEQAMYYALGALKLAGGEDFVSKITIIVVQPRAPHPDGVVRRWETTAQELVSFGDTLKAAAARTREPDAPLIPGDHCRFCPAKPTCPALRQLIAAECRFPDDLGEEGSSGPLLPDPADPAQVARALRIVPILDGWCRSVEGIAFRALEAGHPVPGYKLVRKRSTRKWGVGDDEVIRKLRAKKGVKADDFLEPRKLKTPAKLEKIKAIGKKWVERHAVKPPGGLTVASEGDPRPAEMLALPTFPDDLAALPAEANGTTDDLDDLLT